MLVLAAFGEGTQMVVAAAILVAVLALIIVRPRGLNVAWFAGGGALLALALGLLSAHALLTIAHDTWDAAATLIALFVLSESLDANGFFTWAALRLARVACARASTPQACSLSRSSAAAASSPPVHGCAALPAPVAR